jgi:hypothetical protein
MVAAVSIHEANYSQNSFYRSAIEKIRKVQVRIYL